MKIFEGMTEVKRDRETRKDGSYIYFQAETEAEALEMWEESERGDLAACGAEEIGPHTYKLTDEEPEAINRLYVEPSCYIVELSKWVDGSGISYTETIDNPEEWRAGDAAIYAGEYGATSGDIVEIQTRDGEAVEKYIAD